MPLINSKRRRSMTFLARCRRWLQQLTPYLSLLLLVGPLLLVEPLKLGALFVAAKGHWLAGSVILLGAYIVSLYFIERLFCILKPKLMLLGWFNATWTRFATFRHMAWKWVSSSETQVKQS